MSAAEKYLAMVTAPPLRDNDGNFLGLKGSGCGEHRTVGDYRAWCHACGEWCYPEAPCVGCGPTLDEDLDQILAAHERDVLLKAANSFDVRGDAAESLAGRLTCIWAAALLRRWACEGAMS